MSRTYDYTPPPRLVAYIRVSTSEQGLGAEAQRFEIKKWADARGVEITSYHEDISIRGKRPWPKRPAFCAALAAARTEGARGLVVYKRDRLSRRREIMVAIETELRRRRLSLWSAAGEGSDAILGSQRAMHGGILDVFNEYEVLQLGERIKGAIGVLRRQGRSYSGRPPFGWRKVDAQGEPIRRRLAKGERAWLVVDQGEQAAIAFVHQQHAKGRSHRAIVRDLKAHGFTNREGKPIQRCTIQNILNPDLERPPLLLEPPAP